MSDAAVGHNSGEVNGGQLLAYVERVESVEKEITDRNDDKKQIYGEVRSAGFDAKIVKKVVALRRADPGKRSEEETILGLYLSALGMS